MTDDRLLHRIEGFLDVNYPCRCEDEDCPGNFWEALTIVEIVHAFLSHNVPDYGLARLHGD